MRTRYIKCNLENNPPIPINESEAVVTFNSSPKMKIGPCSDGRPWPCENKDWAVVNLGSIKEFNEDYVGKGVMARVILMREDRGAYVYIRDHIGNQGRNLATEYTGFWVPLEDII
jgi:hypothetical protein